jgi:hypothetical protein
VRGPFPKCVIIAGVCAAWKKSLAKACPRLDPGLRGTADRES